MAQAGPKQPGKGPENRIERGADGALYLLREGQAPRKLTPDETENLTKILQDAEQEVSGRVKKQIPTMDAAIFLVIPEHE
jgi:hypothetical protein